MKSIDNNKMMDGLSTNLIKEPVPLMMQEYVILVLILINPYMMWLVLAV